jgi:hypothetical protein
MSKAMKAAQIDQLCQGKYVMVRRHDDDGSEQLTMADIYNGRRVGSKPPAVGPYRIAATQLPFVCIEVNGRREVIDATDYDWYIVDRKFARAMGLGVDEAEHGRDYEPRFTATKMFQPKKRQRKEKPIKGACTVCGYHKLRQKAVKIDGVYRWVPFCPECGRSGQPVDA